MKKTLIALLLALALVVIPVGTAFAAKTADVTITASGGKLSIAITAGTPYDFGSVIQDDTYSTATTQFTVTNDGTVAADLTIHGYDTTCVGTIWTLSDTATPGADVYGLKFSRDSAPGWTTIPKTGSAVFMGNLAALGTDDFGLQLLTPTDITDTTNQQSAVIRLTATKT